MKYIIKKIKSFDLGKTECKKINVGIFDRGNNIEVVVKYTDLEKDLIRSNIFRRLDGFNEWELITDRKNNKVYDQKGSEVINDKEEYLDIFGPDSSDFLIYRLTNENTSSIYVLEIGRNEFGRLKRANYLVFDSDIETIGEVVEKYGIELDDFVLYFDDVVERVK